MERQHASIAGRAPSRNVLNSEPFSSCGSTIRAKVLPLRPFWATRHEHWLWRLFHENRIPYRNSKYCRRRSRSRIFAVSFQKRQASSSRYDEPSWLQTHVSSRPHSGTQSKSILGHDARIIDPSAFQRSDQSSKPKHDCTCEPNSAKTTNCSGKCRETG